MKATGVVSSPVPACNFPSHPPVCVKQKKRISICPSPPKKPTPYASPSCSANSFPSSTTPLPTSTSRPLLETRDLHLYRSASKPSYSKKSSPIPKTVPTGPASPHLPSWQKRYEQQNCAPQ